MRSQVQTSSGHYVWWGWFLGVVTEATVKAKAYSSPPVVLHLVAISSSTASLRSYLGLNNGQDAKGLYDTVAYLKIQIPSMVDRGTGGIFLTTRYGFMGGSLFIGENATEAYAKSIWDPVLNKMKTFPGMDRWMSNTTSFPMYQDFLSFIWPTITKTVNDAGTQLSARYGMLMEWFVDSNMIPDSDLAQHFAFLETTGNANVQQDPPAFPVYNAFNGDYNKPEPHGIVPMDSLLLFNEHLETLPSASADIKHTFGSRFIIEIVAEPKSHNPNRDAAVLPAWRKTYMSCYTPSLGATELLRQHVRNSGAYINEVRLFIASTR
jgi:hypothetical protein